MAVERKGRSNPAFLFLLREKEKQSRELRMLLHNDSKASGQGGIFQARGF